METGRASMYQHAMERRFAVCGLVDGTCAPVPRRWVGLELKTRVKFSVRRRKPICSAQTPPVSFHLLTLLAGRMMSLCALDRLDRSMQALEFSYDECRENKICFQDDPFPDPYCTLSVRPPCLP
jgi:hypothetical protein